MNQAPVTDSVLLHDVRVMLCALWGRAPPAPAQPFSVPCTTPCSIMRADLHSIKTRAYRAGLKTDGIRFYLLCAFYERHGVEQEYVVMVDRAFHVYLLEGCTLPPDAYNGTLLDGEMTVTATGQMTYVVFDAVAVSGFSVTGLPHSQRVGKAEEVVTSMTLPDMHILLKPWYSVADAIAKYKEAEGKEAVDGLILVHEESPLQAGTQRDLFKWKPSHLHTIDLVFNGHRLLAASHGALVPFLAEHVTWENEDSAPVDTVAEYSFQREGRGWRVTYKLTRDDKTRPNDVRVARLTLQNIDEAISIDELV